MKRATTILLIAASVLAGTARGADRDTNQYVAFGDSITYGAGFYGYPPRLEALILEKYGSAKVWNAGVGGEQTADGLARIDYILSGTNSKFLLLMEGTNDAANLLVSIDTAAFNLREMCRRTVAAGWTPLLATIPPRSDWVWFVPNYQARITDLNARIRQIALDLNLILVDHFAAFFNYPAELGGYPALLFDGLHPNSTGYQLMAETWFAGVKAAKYNPPQPPLSPALDTRLDPTETRKINTVAWQSNPLNTAATVPVRSYRVYRKKAGQTDASFAAIATVGPTVLGYEDEITDVGSKFAYRITALSPVLDESAASATVTETQTFVFPPAAPAVRTVPARSVPSGQKINVVTFAPHPWNDDSLVSGYKVYRRLAGETDDRLVPVATLGPATFRYSDILFRALTPKRVYAVTTLYRDGRESKKSATASDK
jgi:lysophospholipase L1-like esterase